LDFDFSLQGAAMAYRPMPPTTVNSLCPRGAVPALVDIILF